MTVIARYFVGSAVVILGLSGMRAVSAAIPPEIKRVVAFVFVAAEPAGHVTPYGTGFFVGVKDESKPDRSFVYFVTAKHVLQGEEDSKTHERPWLPLVYVRLNKKDGNSEFLKLPIVHEGNAKTVFTDKDASVDIAVVPALPDQRIYDYQFLPDDMITREADFKTLGIQEGSEVFFTGLFAPYLGTKRNYPVVRFGRVALLTDEKIDFAGSEADLYLVESGSYGGNSGSPVYFYVGMERGGNVVLGPPIIKLAGVMKGTFLDSQPVVTVETSQTLVARSNMGIAAVVPAYKLHDILFGGELRKMRHHH